MDLAGLFTMSLQFLLPPLVGVLTVGAARLTTFIHGKVKNEYLEGVLLRLDDAVLTVVKDLEQTIVREIKRASADGKIPVEERRRIKDMALAKLKSYLGPKGLQLLVKVLGLSGSALDAFLVSKIEAAVHDVGMTSRALGAGSARSRDVSPLGVPVHAS